MAHIELAPEVFDDFDRFFEHMAQFEVEDGPERIREILQAVQILEHSPLIGRPVRGGMRELIIGRGSLYWYGRNRTNRKRISWTRFADMMDELAYGK